MNPSQSAVRQAVEEFKKSPGLFQRLAERYAQIVYPARFQHIVPHGRNSGDVPIKGWPDAYTPLPDGRIDAVEATHSHNWKKHIEGDLLKAKKFGQHRLAGFLFIAWARRPSEESLQSYRTFLENLGCSCGKRVFCI